MKEMAIAAGTIQWSGAVRNLPANAHLVWPQFFLLTLLPANVQADRTITRLNRLFPGKYMHFCRQIAGWGIFEPNLPAFMQVSLKGTPAPLFSIAVGDVEARFRTFPPKSGTPAKGLIEC
jgi:hypothetical protein